MIKVKTFILYIDPETGTFASSSKFTFQQGREILDVGRELLNIGGMPAWAMMLNYRDSPRQAQVGRAGARGSTGTRWCTKQIGPSMMPCGLGASSKLSRRVAPSMEC